MSIIIHIILFCILVTCHLSLFNNRKNGWMLQQSNKSQYMKLMMSSVKRWVEIDLMVFKAHILMKIDIICHSRYAHCRNSVIVSNIKFKEVASLHTIKGMEVCLQSFLTLVLDGGEWTASALYPGKAGLVPNQYKARWAPLLVSVLWTREKSLDPVRNGTTIPWLSSP